MKHAALHATALALLTLALSMHQATAAEPPAADTTAAPPACSLKQLAALEVGVLDGQVVFPVELDHHPGIMTLRPDQPVSMVWDRVVREGWLPRHQLLGRPSLRLSPSTALNLPAGSDDKWIDEQATFKSLILGALDFGEGHLLIAPAPSEELREAQSKTFGLLGMDALLQIDFELDLAHNRMNVFSQNHCPGKVVYWSQDYASVPLLRDHIGKMFFLVELDGKQVQATIVPAMAFSTISTELARRVYKFEPSPAGEDEFHRMQIAAPGLTIGNAKIGTREVNTKCVLHVREIARTGIAYESNNLCVSEYPLYIGRNVLQDLRLFFAMKEKKLYFTTANATQ